jgi:transposase-like protein
VQTTNSSINEPNNSSTTKLPRRRFTPPERQAILERYRASGLKQEQFIAREGISKTSLSKWLRKERISAGTELKKPCFQEVLLAPPRSPWQVELVSPQNWTLRFCALPSAPALEQLLGCLPC